MVISPLQAAGADRPPALDHWAIAATVAGNALEFYDFLAYTTFAVYIGRAFFPTQTEFASLLLSLATFGVGFFTRPLGALLIGAFADRAGRRPALMLTIALMAVGTLALAVTPSYSKIGIAAPLILVAARLLQGLALGGEVGPSTAVLLECAPRATRGLYTSWQSGSQGLAVFASGLVGVVVAAILSKQQLADWGWRVPFALGLVIVPVGLTIRRRLPETLLPQQASGAGVLRQLSGQHLGSLTLSVLIIMCLTISTYVNNYMTTYALTTLGLPPFQAMWATLVGGAVITAGAIWSGQLSDRFGRKSLMILPRVALTLVVYPAFAFLVSQKSLGSLVTVAALLNLLSTMSAAAATVAIVETFPNAVRSSGLAVSYALSVSVFGGTTQFVVAWLIGVTHDPLSPAYYVIASSLISLWAMFRLPETNKAPRGLAAA
jgi:MFS family permease